MSLLKFQFTLDVTRPKRACLDTADFPLTLSVSAIIRFQLLSFCAFCGSIPHSKSVIKTVIETPR